MRPDWHQTDEDWDAYWYISWGWVLVLVFIAGLAIGAAL